MLDAASLQKPLPSRPRSVSLPTTPELPAELPGSLLLDNQGYPSDYAPQEPWTITQATQTTSSDICAENRDANQKIQLKHSYLVPESLTHAKSVPNLNVQHRPMNHVQSWAALDSATTSASSPINAQHRRHRSETSRRQNSRLDLGPFPVAREKNRRRDAPTSGTTAVKVTESPQPSSEGAVWDLSTEIRQDSRKNASRISVTPTPTIRRDKQTDLSKVIIPEQGFPTSVLQARSESPTIPNEYPVASSLVQQGAAITTLQPQTRVLEEQQLSSSDNLLFLVESTESPQTPVRESVQDTASSTPSFQIAQEQQWSPQRLNDSPEMENLKRKLSSTRRPEVTSRNLLPELNQYKQNNVALQQQIESLMAKLNEARKRERESRAACEQAEQRRMESETKAVQAAGLAKSTTALQNTIDHLESRLEIANTERLDAEEQLCNMRANRSPFDTNLTKLGVTAGMADMADITCQDPNVSLSTIFSNASPSSPDHEAREIPTLSVFVTHIERLQDQVKQKDTRILELGKEMDELRSKHERLHTEHKDLTLRSDIQADLLQKSRQSDTYLEQLRTAVFDRETVLGEKEESLRAVEKQLDSHKLLLQAEIRRHATVKLNSSKGDESLPQLASLAKQEDIDRWIGNLSRRLEKNRPKVQSAEMLSGPEAEIRSLRHEVEFYVREIIYYKLDIRGYKSDIRKLKRITAQLSSHGGRTSDLDSESSSLRPVPTPSRSRFASGSPDLSISNATSPIATGSKIMSPLSGWPTTPIPSNLEVNAMFTPPDSARPMDRPRQQRPDLRLNTTTQNLESSTIHNHTGGVRTVAGAVRLDPEESAQKSRQPTSPARAREAFDELSARLPLKPPVVSQQPDAPRDLIESMFQFQAASSKPKKSSSVQHARPAANREMSTTTHRDRSASLSDASGRPTRPRLGLFRFASTSSKTVVSRPHMPPINISDLHTEQIPHNGDFDAHGSIKFTPEPAVMPTEVSVAQNIDAPSIVTLLSSERKMSAASNSSVPFVTGMGSPHNPTHIMPAVDYWPTPCSITRDAPVKINASIARTGVGGTMASTTPVTSPVSLTDTSKSTSSPQSTMVRSVRSIFAAPDTNVNPITMDQESARQGGPRTPSHSRTASGSSIRTAIWMPKLRDREKQDVGIVRKDSIGHPKPLGSPFGLERSMSVGSAGRRPSMSKQGDGADYGIGEAM
ncbi:hypothetical protein NX059_003268 [Plenodomus lindquistii]|nr:hypothetical protein NX059_003268 [Plenodomus lindquistii]